MQEEKLKKIKKIGERAEKNTLMEIRVNFAKDILIPKTMRVFREIKEKVYPMDTTIQNGLGIALANETGKTSVVNLGGITVWMEDGRKFSLYSAYDPVEELVEFIVVITPLFHIEDLFEAAAIYCNKPMPSIGMPVEFDTGRSTYMTPLTNKVMYVDKQKISWPLVDGEAYADYLSGMSECIMELCSEICGKA
jgi:hypothetical protein